MLNQIIGGNCGLFQIGAFMSLTDLIGKTPYPRQQRWERRRNAKILLAVAIITLVIIALCGLVMVLNGSGQSRPGLHLPSIFS